MAEDMLLDAMESTIFMCGMAPLDSDDPCHDNFHCDPSLDCNTHIESEFYTSKIEPGVLTYVAIALVPMNPL